MSILLLFVVFEVAFECYTFQREHYEYSAFLREISQRLDFLSKNETDETLFYQNPFIEYAKNKSHYQFKLHPFIDFTGVQGHVEEVITWDYFGFRNEENLYFKDKDYQLVVITGGSEVAGLSHRKTIAQKLEEMLNKRSDRKYKVLNLGMNSYTLSNEINAYVHLAYHLRPEFVISHTAYNDMGVAFMVPYHFRKLGLLYYKVIEMWLPRLYDLKWSDKTEPAMSTKHLDLAIEGFIRNLKKYKTIVEGNGGKFIVGIQGYDIQRMTKNTVYKIISSLMIELSEKLSQDPDVGYRYIDFTKIDGLDYVDPVHSTEETSYKIAEIYADLILKASQDDDPKISTSRNNTL